MDGTRWKKVASQVAIAVAASLVTVTLVGAGPVGAFTVPNNSVTSAKIVNGTIQSIDIKNGTVAIADLAPAVAGQLGEPGTDVHVLSLEPSLTAPYAGRIAVFPAVGGAEGGCAVGSASNADTAPPNSPGCRLVFAQGTVVRLIYFAESGGPVTNVWGGDAASCGSTDCTLTMTRDMHVTVTFTSF